MTRPPDAETWLSSGELGRHWHVDAKTISRYAQHEGLPFKKTPGGHRRFRLDLAKQWNTEREARREANRAQASERLTNRWAARNGQGS